MKNKERILIVDDDSTIILLAADYLKFEGFDVTTARTGTDGLRLIFQKKPDLVILDIMMPEMDGYEVCQKIKSDPEIWHIPVIMLTAKGQSIDEIKGLEIGADDYISKPYNNDLLLARIKALLRRYSRNYPKSNRNTTSNPLLSRLYKFLLKCFDEEELRTFSTIDLGVDYDGLRGDGKAAKARELLMYLERRGRIADLIAQGQHQRPNFAWDKD